MEKELFDGNPDNTGSSEDFFERMENAVNSGIQDNPNQPTEVTPPVNSGAKQVTHANLEGSNNANAVDWEKRYKDSSKEAQRMASELKDLKPFVPVLNAMKNDSGLVQHVRGYFENGGAPAKSVQERLGIADDFVYDQQEALENPNSDSAKVFNAHIDSMVNQRVKSVLTQEKRNAARVNAQIRQKQMEEEFKAKHNMSEEDFGELVEQAKTRALTLDDIHYLLNRDQANANVADATKKDMLNQMKSVRDIPASASGANSQGDGRPSFEDEVFETLLGADGDIDNLFG